MTVLPGSMAPVFILCKEYRPFFQKITSVAVGGTGFLPVVEINSFYNDKLDLAKAQQQDFSVFFETKSPPSGSTSLIMPSKYSPFIR